LLRAPKGAIIEPGAPEPIVVGPIATLGAAEAAEERA
jgi:hypothetical protein